MADVSRVQLSSASFYGDDNTIIEAGDIAATPDNQSGRACMKFPDGTDESAMVSQAFPFPTQYTSGDSLKVKIDWFGDSAPGENNGVQWDVAVEAITPGDAHDLQGTADAFAAAQSGTGTVNASAGYLNSTTITLTQAQADAVAAGDSVRLCIRRDSNHASDTYADSVWITEVEVLEVTA